MFVTDINSFPKTSDGPRRLACEKGLSVFSARKGMNQDRLLTQSNLVV